MTTRETIKKVFLDILREDYSKTVADLDDGLILLESGMDSLGFAILVTRLEEELGYDPFAIAADAYYPVTFGDFVRFYETSPGK